MAKPSSEKATSVKAVKEWIQQFIIKHDICPFAAYSIDQHQLEFYTSASQDIESSLVDMASFLRDLSFAKKGEVTNAICIFYQWEVSFLTFIDFYYLGVDLLAEMKLESEFQLIAFHPDYVFEGESPDAHSHFTNRSPYPLIHIVKVEDMEKAIKSYGDTTAIYKRNIDYLNQLPKDELEKWTKERK